MTSTLQANLAQIKKNISCLKISEKDALANDLSIHDLTIRGVVTDSRKITPGCLFVALCGEKFDAHDFLADVAQQGAGAVVVERVPENFPIPALVVADTRIALGEIGRFWRAQFSLPVIGVTGSNGKTTVKEMIASILAATFGAEHSLATQGNLNNDIGVPQTIFRLSAQHQAAVIELGMNHPGEIAELTKIALPTVGLVNNAQREHQEFMQSVQAVAIENGAVILSLPEDGVAVFPANDEFTSLWRGYAGQRRVVTFGVVDHANQTTQADVSATYEASVFGSQLAVRIGHDQFSVQLHAAGLHNVNNALAAIACTHAIGCSVASIIAGLENFKPVSGRLQKKEAANLATIIDDTYNANPDSVRAAIDVLAQAQGQKILVLGDMGEVGVDGPAYHDEIGRYAKQRGIDILYTLGELARNSSAVFGESAEHFEQIEALFKALDDSATNSSTVLIKGSRFMKMERVVAYLMNSER